MATEAADGLTRTLGHRVTLAAYRRLKRLNLELQERGRECSMALILDVLIKGADIDALEKLIPPSRHS